MKLIDFIRSHSTLWITTVVVFAVGYAGLWRFTRMILYRHNAPIADQFISDCKAHPGYHPDCSKTRDEMIWEGLRP